ncbi:hypothetical protein DSECCO2_629150 [anaerobic digester metagenome]
MLDPNLYHLIFNELPLLTVLLTSAGFPWQATSAAPLTRMSSRRVTNNVPSAAPEKTAVQSCTSNPDAETSLPPLALRWRSSVFPDSSISLPPLVLIRHRRDAMFIRWISLPPLASAFTSSTFENVISASLPPEKLPVKLPHANVRPSRSLPPLIVNSKSRVFTGVSNRISTPPDAVILFKSVTVT